MEEFIVKIYNILVSIYNATIKYIVDYKAMNEIINQTKPFKLAQVITTGKIKEKITPVPQDKQMHTINTGISPYIYVNPLFYLRVINYTIRDNVFNAKRLTACCSDFKYVWDNNSNGNWLDPSLCLKLLYSILISICRLLIFLISLPALLLIERPLACLEFIIQAIFDTGDRLTIYNDKKMLVSYWLTFLIALVTVIPLACWCIPTFTATDQDQDVTLEETQHSNNMS